MDVNKHINYLGALLIAEVSEDSRAIDVTKLRLKDREQLSIDAKCSYGVKSTTKIHFEALIEERIVYFQELGLNLPCFLVLAKAGSVRTRKEAYLLILINESLQLYTQTFLPAVVAKEETKCFDLKILNGPSIFILDKKNGGMYVYHHSNGVFKKYSPAALDIDSSLCKSYRAKSIASDTSEFRTFCFVDIKYEKTSKMTTAIQIAEDGTIEELNPAKSLDVLLPAKEYWQTMTAFSYHKLSPEIYGECFAKSSSKREIFVLLATETKQFVISKGNWNIWCFDIPFDDCLKIEKIEVPYFDTFFVLTSKSLQCCVVSWKQKKVIKHWIETHGTFVGDFCRTGHNQILVLLSSAKSDNIRFSLTDFLCCKKGFEGTADNNMQSIEVQKSLQAVKKALVHNIQTIKLEIEEKQTAYERKAQLIKTSLLCMQKMSLRLNTSEERPKNDLVPLFGTESNVFEGTNEDVKVDDNPLKILDQHDFIANGRLVVTLKVLNNTNKKLTNMNLQIFLADHTSQASIPSSSNQNLSSNRKSIDSSWNSPVSAHPGGILTLSASTEAPHLRPDQPVEVPLIVEWNQNDCKHSFAYNVGKVTLDLKNYPELLCSPDQSTLTTHLESIQVEVISSHYSLSDCIDRLTNTLKKLKCKVTLEASDFEPNSCLGDNHGQVFIGLSKSGMIAAIQIQARTMFDAMQLFYIVQSELPNGCTVSLPSQKQEELVIKFAHCLDNELSILNRILKCEGTHSAAISNMDIDIPSDSKENSSDPKQAVERKRQQVGHKRKLAEMLMQDGKHLKIDKETYDEYCKAVQATDNIGELLAKIFLGQ